MNDTHNDTPDTEHDDQSNDASGKTARRGAALIVRPGTRGVLDALRVRMRMTGLANLRVEVREILEQDWTSDTLVRAGCAAINVALDDSSGLNADTDRVIDGIRVNLGLPAGMAGRLAAIDALAADYVRLQKAAGSTKAAAKAGKR